MKKEKFFAAILIFVAMFASQAFAKVDPKDSSGFVKLSEAVPDVIL